MSPPLPSLVCKECGYVNEGERVYCHGCGMKLDREILIAREQEQAAAAQKRQREVKRIMTPGRRNWAKIWKSLCKTLIFAAIAAALIDAALPPQRDIPSLPPGAEVEPLPIDSVLENLVAAPAAKRIGLREADVNAYLKKERFKKVPTWLTNAIPLRALVSFDDGVAHLTLLGTIRQYPIYVTLAGNLKIDKENGLTGVCTGGNIGRLQIPVQLAQYAGLALPILLDSMKHERKLLGQIGSIEFRKKQVVLGSPRLPVPAVAPVAPKPAAH